MADISIPSYLNGPLNYLMEAIDSTRGVETSPVPMDVNINDIAEDPDTSRSVVFKGKIHVDKNKRIQVRDEVADYLNNILDRGNYSDFVEIKVGSTRNPDAEQLDMVIEPGQKPKVIRILIKPTSAGGSGGGAAKTKIQEVGQALFAAIRYDKGKDLECHPNNIKGCLTTSDYAKGMESVDGPGVTVEEIEGLEQSWKNAFILGANKIAKEVKGDNWEFVRGDNKLEAAISKAFLKVKNKKGSKAPVNEDKWNPSDIWMVKKGEMDKIVTKLGLEGTIDCLNDYIALMFNENKLKGLSLKKLGTSARWLIMNEPNVKQLDKAQKVRFIKNKTFNELTAFSGMDVYLVYTPSGGKTKDSFQARNFGGKNKGDWKLELKGEFAAQGKIQGQVMRDLLTAAGFTPPQEASFAACKAKNQTKIINDIYNKMNALSPKPQGWIIDETKAKAEIRGKDASWKYSKLSGLLFLEWMNSLPQSQANKAMKEMYLYASSQTDKSSVYYKLY